MVTRHAAALALVAPVERSPWYTRSEAAEYAQVSPRTVDEARRRGELVASRIAGRGRHRYHRSDLDRWLGGGGRLLRVLNGGAA